MYWRANSADGFSLEPQAKSLMEKISIYYPQCKNYSFFVLWYTLLKIWKTSWVSLFSVKNTLNFWEKLKGTKLTF